MDNIGGANQNRIRVALRVDDDVAGDQWIREIIGRYDGVIKARLGLGAPNSNAGEQTVYAGQLVQFLVKGVWNGVDTITYSYTLAPTSVETYNNWIPASTAHSTTGTPSLGRIFVSNTSSANSGRVGPVRLSTAYSEVVTEAPISKLPVTSMATELQIDLDGSISEDDGNITVYNWDFGDGNTDNISGFNASHEYALPGTYTVSLTVEDNDGLVSEVYSEQISVQESALCSPVSVLDCEDVVVSLPVNLDFSAGIPNTISDASDSGTGFTAVLEHSEARRSGDLSVTDASINGYEPTLLALNSGVLQITSQAGIAFRQPGGSSNVNNQVNTLGVGLENITEPIVIRTTLLNIATGPNAAQAGIWFGYDEDNFVKLDVNDNNVELRVESGGLSGNGSTGSDQVQFDLGASGQNVTLELILDPADLTAEAYHTIGANAKTLLGSLPVPADYFTGRDINTSGGQDNVTFAGIFASHRNGSQFTASFDDFVVESEVIASTETDIIAFSIPEQTGGAVIDAENHTITIEVTNGTILTSLVPTIGLSQEPVLIRFQKWHRISRDPLPTRLRPRTG